MNRRAIAALGLVAVLLLAGCAGMGGSPTDAPSEADASSGNNDPTQTEAPVEKHAPIDNSCTVANSSGSTVTAEYNYETYEDRTPYTEDAELLVVEFRFSECIEPKGYEFFPNGDNEIPRKGGANNILDEGGVNGGYIAYIIEQGEFEQMEDANQGQNTYHFEYNETIPVTHPDKFDE